MRQSLARVDALRRFEADLMRVWPNRNLQSFTLVCAECGVLQRVYGETLDEAAASAEWSAKASGICIEALCPECQD